MGVGNELEGVVIRPGVGSDCVALAALSKRFFPYIHLSPDAIYERIQSGVQYFVLEREDTLLGFVDFEFYEAPRTRHQTEREPLQGKSVKVLGLCVDESLQGKGWGKRLLTAVLAEAKTQCRQAVILVEESNSKAIALYEQAGFKRHGKLQQKLWGKEILLFTKAL